MRFCVLILCGFLSLPALAAENISLSSSVALALGHAPSLQAAEAARNAAHEDATLGRAWLLPYVAFNASLMQKRKSERYVVQSPFLPNRVYRSRDQAYRFRIYQPIFDMEKWAIYKQGEASSHMADVALSLQQQTTVLQISAAWLNVLRRQAQLQAILRSERAIERLSQRSMAAFAAGTMNVNDSLAAQSRLDLAHSYTIHARQSLQQAESKLSSLVGQDVQVQVSLKDDLQPVSLADQGLSAWLHRAEQHALKVRLSGERLAMATAADLQALGSALPKLQLVLGWDHLNNSDGSFGGLKSTSSRVGLELSAPLYAGGSILAKKRKSEQLKVEAEFQQEEAIRQARLATQQAFDGLLASASELRALSLALKSTALEKQAATEGLSVGLRTMSEALDAEERLAQARSSYMDVLAGHAFWYLRLYAAVGELNEERVAILQRKLFASH